LNLHLAAAAIGRGAARDAGMGGGGLGVRFKPMRRFGIEADADYYGGTDYSGNTRNEEAFTLNGLLFINPRSRAQAYLVAGLGFSTAHVSCDPSAGCAGGAFDAQYGYFGGQTGAGFELRLGRTLALNADLRGFLRTRIDSGAQSQPEFVDAFGHTSNTSAGALFTAGMTFYF
jgi:Outer membrane protein beta-barrel domain